MKKLIYSLAVGITLLATAGCNSLFKTIVTVTEVRDSVMRAFATHYAEGKISPKADARIAEADKQYRLAVASAAKALRVYKETKTGDPVAILNSVKITVDALIAILSEYENVVAFDKSLAKASAL